MKIFYTIFRSNQFCIISSNNVTVLPKSVHAIRQCLEKESFSKMTSFSLENEYSPAEFGRILGGPGT